VPTVTTTPTTAATTTTSATATNEIGVYVRMKQRGRSPVAKPQLPSARLGDSATGSGGPPTGLRAGGSSSKSLTSELLQDFRWDDSSEISAKEESGLVSLLPLLLLL